MWATHVYYAVKTRHIRFKFLTRPKVKIFTPGHRWQLNACELPGPGDVDRRIISQVSAQLNRMVASICKYWVKLWNFQTRRHSFPGNFSLAAVNIIWFWSLLLLNKTNTTMNTKMTPKIISLELNNFKELSHQSLRWYNFSQFLWFFRTTYLTYLTLTLPPANLTPSLLFVSLRVSLSKTPVEKTPLKFVILHLIRIRSYWSNENFMKFLQCKLP